MSSRKKNNAKTTVRVVGPERKERVTITLSRDSAEYVRTVSARERSHVSTVMDRMIESVRRAEELRQLNADISAFYDALPEAAAAEDVAWGQLGAEGLAALVESETDETSAESSDIGKR
jgi:hypothetical protein